MGKVKKVFEIFINVLLAVLILIGIIVGVSLLPIRNNYKILTVMSGSMAPKIKTGYLIVIRPSSNYQVGDIITFHSLEIGKNNEMVTHRIFDILDRNGTKTYITRGDANNVSDAGVITGDRIVGKCLFGIPLLGYLIGYVKTLPGLILIIIVPATIIVLEESKKIVKEIKRIKRKRAREKLKIETEEAG